MDDGFLQISLLLITTSVLGALSIFLKQPIVAAYILAGILLGPHVSNVFSETEIVHHSGHFGVALLLFLAGIELQPRQFGTMLQRLAPITLATGAIFALVGFLWGVIWQFTLFESLILGLGSMFSSTILVVKLLPTLTLHQKHMGAVSIAVLIIQDIMAVTVLVFLGKQTGAQGLFVTLLETPLLLLVVFSVERWLLRPVMMKISSYAASLYMLSIGWRVLVALFAEWIGLSREVGGFIAGVSLARSPLSTYIFQGLEFMRDFFLVMFFFYLGMQFDPDSIFSVGLPALGLAVLFLWGKPKVTRWGLQRAGEEVKSHETSVRLGQHSEFALIIASAALSYDSKMYQLILLVTLIMMLVNSYWVILKYPTPIATSKELKQD